MASGFGPAAPAPAGGKALAAPPPYRGHNFSRVIQRVKSSPDLSELRLALAKCVSSKKGECRDQAAAASRVLRALVDDAAELGAVIMHWIDLDEQGEPAGWNHVACKVQWAEGTYVIDTTWQQFGNKGCDNPIFIGSADEWMKLILQNQDKVQTSKFQPLDKVPTDNAMMLEVMGYEKDYKDSQQKTSSQNTQQPLTTIKSKDNSCCIIQ